MNLCPYCKEPASSVGYGDEYIDYCHDCEVVIEGLTVSEPVQIPGNWFMKYSWSTRGDV